MKKLLVGILFIFVLMNVNALVTVVDANLYSIKIPVLTAGEPVNNTSAECDISGSGRPRFFITQDAQFGTTIKSFEGAGQPTSFMRRYSEETNFYNSMGFERDVTKDYYLSACIGVQTSAETWECTFSSDSHGNCTVYGVRNFNKACLDEGQAYNYLRFSCYYSDLWRSTVQGCDNHTATIPIQVTPNFVHADTNYYCLPLGQI